jgi:hypothetical protein
MIGCHSIHSKRNGIVGWISDSASTNEGLTICKGSVDALALIPPTFFNFAIEDCFAVDRIAAFGKYLTLGSAI